MDEMVKLQRGLWSYKFEHFGFDGTKSHTIRLRGITKKGPSDWSTFTVPSFKKGKRKPCSVGAGGDNWKPSEGVS